jgi:anthranilate/para-aminobenzoate synthase component I
MRDPEGAWQAISTFIDSYANDHVVGYIGFDIHYFGQSAQQLPSYPSTLLIVPQHVIHCTPDAAHGLAGDSTALREWLAGRSVWRCNGVTPQPGTSLGKSWPDDYIHTVAQVLDWIHHDKGEQLTVARRIRARAPIDLLRTMSCCPVHSDQSRCFYVRTARGAFAGQSPELLADGTAESFRTYKVSGTGPCSQDADADRELREHFVEDPKIRDEHARSVRSMQAALQTIGDVSKLDFGIVELPALHHLMTMLETKPHTGTGIGACLRASFPVGATPRIEGLARLPELEPVARGAYYGLIGCIEPGGTFTFSQTLRAVFHDSEGDWFWAGAAVTAMSTPEDEYHETLLKLASTLVVPRL